MIKFPLQSWFIGNILKCLGVSVKEITQRQFKFLRTTDLKSLLAYEAFLQGLLTFSTYIK